MNDVIQFIADHGKDIIYLVCLLIISIVQIIKYGKVSKEVKEELKYRSPNYREGNTDSSNPGQTFSRVVPTLAYDERSGKLYESGTKDLQEIVQSSVDCALDRILDKFGALPLEMQPKAVESNAVNIVDVTDDLLQVSDMFDEFEDIRSKYHFGDDVSYSDMFKQLEKMKEDYSAQVQETVKNQQIIKEVPNDEKKA